MAVASWNIVSNLEPGSLGAACPSHKDSQKDSDGAGGDRQVGELETVPYLLRLEIGTDQALSGFGRVLS